jgi:hypothetical protein
MPVNRKRRREPIGSASGQDRRAALVDTSGHLGRRCGVARVERASFQERHAHRLEIIPRDGARIDQGVVARLGRATIDRDRPADDHARFAGRPRRHAAGVEDARQRADALDGLLEERHPLLRRVEPARREDLHDRHPGAIEPRIDAADEHDARPAILASIRTPRRGDDPCRECDHAQRRAQREAGDHDDDAGRRRRARAATERGTR